VSRFLDGLALCFLRYLFGGLGLDYWGDESRNWDSDLFGRCFLVFFRFFVHFLFGRLAFLFRLRFLDILRPLVDPRRLLFLLLLLTLLLLCDLSFLFFLLFLKLCFGCLFCFFFLLTLPLLSLLTLFAFDFFRDTLQFELLLFGLISIALQIVYNIFEDILGRLG